MAKHIMQMVKSPAHGGNGELLYQVGDLFEPDAELPGDVVTAEVIATDEQIAASKDAQAARAQAAAPEPEPEPEKKAPAKAPAAKAGKGD